MNKTIENVPKLREKLAATNDKYELYPEVLNTLGSSASDYSLASLRYDLSKLRAKKLVQEVPHSRKYRLLPSGYSV